MRWIITKLLPFMLTLGLVQVAGGQVTQEWARRINFGDAVGNDDIEGLAVDAQGNVYVGGTADLGPGRPNIYVVVKYAPEGEYAWIAPYNPPHASCDAADFTLDAAGNTYLTGQAPGPVPGSPTDYLTVKFNPLGQVEWAATYDGPIHYYDGAKGIALDDSGNVYVTGESSGEPTYPYEFDDYATIKYNAQGVEQWLARYDGAAHCTDRAVDVAVDGLGNVYVLGSSIADTVVTQFDMVTVKYNAQGIQQWEARLVDSGNPSMLLVDDQSNVFVSGEMAGPGSSDLAVIKYDSDGNQQWLAQYNTPENGDDDVSAICLDSDGNIIAAGGTYFGMNHRTLTLKFDPNGNLIWVRRYESDGNSGYGLALDPEQNIYVTGYTGWGYSHCLTLKYSPLGDLLWSTVFNDHHNTSHGKHVCMDEEGNVLVAGSCAIIHNPEAGDDFLTIKYNQSPERAIQGEANQSAHPPAVFSLTSFPNPFNPTTAIRFTLPEASAVRLEVFDVNGSNVWAHGCAPWSGSLYSAGSHEFTFDGSGLPSGVYYYRLTAGANVASGKMVLMK